jgi:hypothetical protein
MTPDAVAPDRRRARLLSLAAALCLAPLAAAQPEVCDPGFGPIVLEVESTPPVASWAQETTEAGYTGDGYFRWTGSNHYNQPGNGILTYIVNIETAGTYNMRIRNLHVNPDGTLENDCWVRMDGGTWLKSFSSIPLVWNWATWIDPAAGSDYKAFFVLSEGAHTFEISARSREFRIDRVHFYLDGTPGNQTETWPQSDCPTQWTDVGNGKAGTGGLVPVLEGTGELTDGSSNQIDLMNALPSTTCNLVLGLTALNAPFKSGVLVPAPDFLFLGLPVDGAGNFSLPFTWPSGIPAGTQFWSQYWISDPGAVKNFSASNGLQGEAQ